MGDPVKLTNLQVLESLSALAVLAKVKMPAKTAYAVAKAANKLSELEKPIRAVQKTLWEKYGEKDEAGKLKVAENGNLTIPAANVDGFNKDNNELLEVSNDVTGLRQVLLSEFQDAAVEPSAFVPLGWFIKDDA